MGTEIAQRQTADVVPLDLTDWAQAASAVYTIAEQLCRTSFVPEAFRAKPHEAAAAILSGRELGFSPMASLRAFDIIQGTAAPRALTLRAVVQAAGHEIWTEESTATRAVVCGRRRGSDHVERSVWTIDRAQKMGLTGKPNWRNMPQSMLLARANAEASRMVGADVIAGIAYAAEEIDGSAEPAEGPAVTPKKRTAKRAALPPAQSVPPAEPTVAQAAEPDEPDLEPMQYLDDQPTEPAPEPEDVPDPLGVTDKQLKLIGVLCRQMSLDRDAAHAYISDVVGRDLASSKELTKTEASQVITAMKSDADYDEPKGA